MFNFVRFFLVPGYRGHPARKARTRLVGWFSERNVNGGIAGVAIMSCAVAVIWVNYG